MRATGSFRTAAFAVLVLAATLLASPAAQASDVVLDGILAVANGHAITKYELDQRMAPVYDQLRGRHLSAEQMLQVEALKKKILDQMIDDELLVEESARYKLKVSDSEVEDQIKVFQAKRKLSDAEFERQLSLQHMTRAEFAQNMRRDIIRHRIIGGEVINKIVVTDSEVAERYKARKAEFSKDSMVELSLVLLPAGMSAKDLKAEIEAGKLTFADAAKKYSQGPNASNGGDIGFIAWKDLAPEWNAALAGLKPGQITNPVRIQDFEGLLQVVSFKKGEELPLDAVREQIYQSLHEEKFEKTFQEYMRKLREKAVIEYKTL